jgi:hypothetical protein
MISSFHFQSCMKNMVSSPSLDFCADFCLLYGGISGTWSLPSAQSLPLDTCQRVRSHNSVVHGCRNNEMLKQHSQEHKGVFLQLLPWYKCICTWSTFICAYLSLCTLGNQTYLQFIYAHIFFKSSMSIAVCILKMAHSMPLWFHRRHVTWHLCNPLGVSPMAPFVCWFPINHQPSTQHVCLLHGIWVREREK